MCIRHSAFHCYRGDTPDDIEGGTEKDGIVVDANTGGLVIKGGNCGKNVGEGGGCVRLAVYKNSNN